MKHFRYSIAEDEIVGLKGEIGEVPEVFIEYHNDFSPEKIYYKIDNKKVTEVIGEGYDEEAAKRRVEDFLSALNVNLF